MCLSPLYARCRIYLYNTAEMVFLEEDRETCEALPFLPTRRSNARPPDSQCIPVVGRPGNDGTTQNLRRWQGLAAGTFTVHHASKTVPSYDDNFFVAEGRLYRPTLPLCSWWLEPSARESCIPCIVSKARKHENKSCVKGSLKVGDKRVSFDAANPIDAFNQQRLTASIPAGYNTATLHGLYII
jgi:hypothetical protein